MARGLSAPVEAARRRLRTGRAVALIATLAWLGIGSTAEASLGRSRDSVETDRAHLSARMTSVVAATHTTHTLTLPNGGTVREYVRPDGVVFAVSWRGPGRPDLRQLLGPSFDTLQAAQAPAGRRLRRAPLSVEQSDLLIHSGGHPGAFWGFAYLPQQAPEGFSGKDLR